MCTSLSQFGQTILFQRMIPPSTRLLKPETEKLFWERFAPTPVMSPQTSRAAGGPQTVSLVHPHFSMALGQAIVSLAWTVRVIGPRTRVPSLMFRRSLRVAARGIFLTWVRWHGSAVGLDVCCGSCWAPPPLSTRGWCLLPHLVPLFPPHCLPLQPRGPPSRGLESIPLVLEKEEKGSDSCHFVLVMCQTLSKHDLGVSSPVSQEKDGGTQLSGAQRAGERAELSGVKVADSGKRPEGKRLSLYPLTAIVWARG